MTNHIIRFALIGDVEPKPLPIFTNFEKAIKTINALHQKQPLDFVAGIGDITHKGSVEQYEGALPILTQLTVPFWNIIGNEECGGGLERYKEYAAQWQKKTPSAIELSFVRTIGNYAFIFITASGNGVQLGENDLDWLREQAQQYSKYTKVLFTHAPVKDVFEINQARSIQSENFEELLKELNIKLHFSGHTHMDPDYVPIHVLKQGIHYVHAPGIERTKVGDGNSPDAIDGNTHTPRFRLIEIEEDGKVTVQTYNLQQESFEEKHKAEFTLS